MVAESDEENRIGLHLIGNLDPDGYLRRPLANLVDDLAFQENLVIQIPRLQEVLAKVQELDPPGVGAQDLQECLLLQLRRRLLNRGHWSGEEGNAAQAQGGIRWRMLFCCWNIILRPTVSVNLIASPPN